MKQFKTAGECLKVMGEHCWMDSIPIAISRDNDVVFYKVERICRHCSEKSETTIHVNLSSDIIDTIQKQ